jgi:hypothetical protein
MGRLNDAKVRTAPPTLRKLLSTHLPQFARKGVLSEIELAKALGCSTAHVQRMLRLNRVFKRNIQALCSIPESTLTPEILAPYIFDGDNYVPTLEEVLADNLPQHASRIKRGSVSTTALASDLGCSRETIYKMFRANRLHSHYVNRLISLPGSTLTIEKLTPYINLG